MTILETAGGLNQASAYPSDSQQWVKIWLKSIVRPTQEEDYEQSYVPAVTRNVSKRIATITISNVGLVRHPFVTSVAKKLREQYTYTFKASVHVHNILMIKDPGNNLQPGA